MFLRREGCGSGGGQVAVEGESPTAHAGKQQGRWGMLKGAMAFGRSRTFARGNRSSKSSSSLPASPGEALPSHRAQR